MPGWPGFARSKNFPGGCTQLELTETLVENLNQTASTRCSSDKKEKLSTNIHSEHASDFCHDRKSTFGLIFSSLDEEMGETVRWAQKLPENI